MSVLSTDTQTLIEEYLVKTGQLKPDGVQKLKKEAHDKNIPFFSYLVSEDHLTNEQLTKTMATVTNVPYVNLSRSIIDPDILALLPQEIAERYMAVPLGKMQHRLVVAMLDADNVQAVDFLSNKIGHPLKVYAASEEGIRRVLSQYKSNLNQDIVGALGEQVQTEEDAATSKNKKSNQSIEAIVQDSPVSKALSAILEYAASNRASDIHIEPLEKELKIRARIDGILREIMRLPKATEAPLVSRIKILASMKIDEHRIPQDGQFTIKALNREIDLRIAISPVVWGEQVVIRLLDKSGTSLKLEDMGYTGRALNKIREALKFSNGMILTSGPTGSGKSTSMYALINEIKDDSINIVTLEDPVEYKMSGVNQIQVNPEVGLTFAAGLRSILRQDPNVVMVGEIRDKETAQLAVQAALTGHLVFSTLHTNSAAGILPRLLDMGIEPFLIASTVRAVIGQRLVRRLNEDKEEYKSDGPEHAAVEATLGQLLPTGPEDMAKVCADLGYKSLPTRGQSAYTLYKGKDSPDAQGGFKGRMGLYEVFDVSETIQDLVIKQATSNEIQKAARAQGMITMREDGYLKALAGYTSLVEVDRVAAADNA
jgi:type IV pilus assembly protein PilB